MTTKRAALSAPARGAPVKRARAARAAAPPASASESDLESTHDDDDEEDESLGSGFEDLEVDDAGSSEDEFAADQGGATLQDSDGDDDGEQMIGDDGEDLYANLDDNEEEDGDDSDASEDVDDLEAGEAAAEDDDGGGWETVGTAPSAPLIAPAAELDKRKKAKVPKLSAAEIRALAFAELTASPISNVLATRVAALLDPLTPAAPSSSPLQPVLKDLHAALTTLPKQKPVSLEALRKKGRVVPKTEGSEGKWAKLELAWEAPQSADIRVVGNWVWGGAIKDKGEYFVDLAVTMPSVRSLISTGSPCHAATHSLTSVAHAGSLAAQGLSRAPLVRQIYPLPRHPRSAPPCQSRSRLAFVRPAGAGLRARSPKRLAQGRDQSGSQQGERSRDPDPHRRARRSLPRYQDCADLEPRAAAFAVFRSRGQQSASRPELSPANAAALDHVASRFSLHPDLASAVSPFSLDCLPRVYFFCPSSPSVGNPTRLRRLARLHI